MEAHHEQRGARVRRFLVLGGRPSKFGVDVMWDEQGWTLQTEAWVESEKEGMELLRELPERTAEDLSSLLEHLRSAVSDLAKFTQLVQ